MSTEIADLTAARQAYADNIAAAAALTTPGLREALAAVPRERFLRAGPWLVIGESDGKRPSGSSTIDDPRHLYANVSVAIDPGRQLFNGAPVYLTRLIDALGLRPGGRVLHVGAGLGYYSAVMAHVVGASGSVVALEVDESLLDEARANLAHMPWVEVRREADRSRDAAFDAILVNTGVTHPDAAWLNGLAIGGRLIVPLTVAMPAMGHSLGKGVVVAIERSAGDRFTAAMVSFIAIYSAVGLRDPVMEGTLSQALRRTSFPNLTRLRRDAHESSDACWLHGEHFCLSMEPA